MSDFIEIKSKSKGKRTDIVCKYCKENGHILIECPKIQCKKCKKRGHVETNCTVSICSFCNKIGHLENDCYAKNKSSKNTSSNFSNKNNSAGSNINESTDSMMASDNQCQCCGEYGHYYCI